MKSSGIDVIGSLRFEGTLIRIVAYWWSHQKSAIPFLPIAQALDNGCRFLLYVECCESTTGRLTLRSKLSVRWTREFLSDEFTGRFILEGTALGVSGSVTVAIEEAIRFDNIGVAYLKVDK